MSTKLSRRDFIRFSAAGAAGAMLMPSTLVAATQNSARKTGANDTINIGFIGLGQQAMSLLRSCLAIPTGVRVVAGADLYDVKRARFEKRVKAHYAEAKQRVDVKTYERYQDLLARPDIDGVVIATPDHYHALIAIAACRAGKDVYLEKPMTFTIYEGQQLIEAVRANNRILQVGSQQRSSAEFLHVAGLIREGGLGNIQRVKVYVGDPAAPIPYDLPEQPVPAGLDWDVWHGPLAQKFHFNNDLNPIISATDEREKVWGAWRWYQGLGGGYMTDWGAHMFDIAQWALGKDDSGPVEIIPPGFSYHDHLTYKYDNGTVMTQQEFDGKKQGCKFYGDNGWIQVRRGEVLASDPAFLPKASASDDVPYETNVPHMQTFINSMRSRRDPNVTVEIGHSSCTVCNLGNIAYELGRPLKWNPIVQKFMGNDTEATSRLHYQYRAGYSL
ncbi:MAG: Gfo/Idh/MocA family oxidoreductase [Alistipes sp.]|jgi:predicted dehydrogenase|nr:Gfo/Idh/MocA family oxidoreductase [Alistipes sp.]